MNRFFAIACGIALFAALAAPIATRADDADTLLAASSGWVNQSGSTMTLNISGDGSVTGTYVNNAPGFNCQGTPYQLAGRVLGNFISFAVAWNNAYASCNSVTGWTGYAVQNAGNVSIMANWNLAYQGTSGPAVQAGQDVFTPVNKVEMTSPMK